MLVPAGSLAVARLESFLPGWEGKGPRVRVLFAPSESTSIADFFVTRNFIVVTAQEDVRTYLLAFHHDGEQWQSRRIHRDLPGTVWASAVDDVEGDELWITATGFIQPSTLYLGDLAPLLEGGDPSPTNRATPVTRNEVPAAAGRATAGDPGSGDFPLPRPDRCLHSL